MITNNTALRSALRNISDQLKNQMANNGFGGANIAIRINKPGYVVSLMMTAHNVLQAYADQASLEGRTVLDARVFATSVHVNQTDKLGRPYIGHLGRVAARSRAHADALSLNDTSSDLCEQIGWLHDSMRDKGVTRADLTDAGFAPEVIESIVVMTRPRSMPYVDYIHTIAVHGNDLAVIVKLSDLDDNLDPARADGLTDALRLRYEAAKEALLLRLPKI